MCAAQIYEVSDMKKKLAALTERIEKRERAPKTLDDKHRKVIIRNVPPMKNENIIAVADLGKGDVKKA